MCTSYTYESVLTGDETLRKPVNHAPLAYGKVHSLLNETLIKPLNRAPLKHGKVNSLLNETLRKVLNSVPLEHGKDTHW